jgi:transcriptional regulator with XRE-family HTH domain
MKMKDATIGLRIKVLRKQRGMPQWQLANKMDMSQAIISRWERGGRNPGLRGARALSNVLGKSVGFILYGE